MESHSHHQPGHLCIHFNPHPPGNRAPHADLHGRIPHHFTKSQHAGSLSLCSHFFMSLLISLQFGAAAMALGYANFIIVPFSNVFGRRPTILICGLLCVLANIWQAKVTSYNSFIGARVISGLGAAANESIMPMVVADVYFLHERGLWMGLYL
jgi:MFS family permease